MDRAYGGPVELLERREETQALSRLLSGAMSGAGAFALVEGPAGIGKTGVLDACAGAAQARGLRVLRACGDEVAMELPFAAVRELLWEAQPAAREGAEALAAPVFEPDGAGLDTGRVGGVLHGLYWLVANLAERQPLALLVDDAHWLDQASARFIAYLARRITALPALLVTALRDGETSSTAVAGLPELAATVLRPAPLSEEAATRLVRAELGARADEELCRSCHQATGGNPFYLRALTAALAGEGRRPTLELAARVRSLGAGAVRRTVLLRLARMGGDCERLAQAVAVLAPGSPLRHGAELAELGRGPAAEAADHLRAAGLLDPAQPLAFSHPIVREAIAAEIPLSRRAALNLHAAELLAREGAASDRIAAHLKAAEPYGERWVVDALRVAAGKALARGAPEAAVSYLRRALAEPPPAELRPELLRELGRAERELPYPHDFSAFREALELAQTGAERAEIAIELAWGLTAVARNTEVVTLLEPVLDERVDLDPATQETIEALLIGAGAPVLALTPRLRARAERHFERARRAEVHDPVMAGALGVLGAMTALPAREVADMARVAFASPRLLEFPTAVLAVCSTLIWSDQLEQPVAVLDAAISEAARLGSAPMFVLFSVWRSEAALRAGDLAAAEERARWAYEPSRELDMSLFPAMSLIPALVEQGRAQEALALGESVDVEAALGLWQGPIVLSRLGAARVILGQVERGLGEMLEADRRMAAAGCQLSVVTDWVGVAAPALARAGRDREAAGLAARELAQAQAYGAPHRLGAALSTCGSLDPGSQGLAQLEEAVAVLAAAPAPLEHARALVNLGAGLAGRGEHLRAREPLALGLDLAHGLGAALLAERARGALVASGARPRREALSGPGSLTAAELRTARMAAEGLSNREIAEALFVSAKTVETHLSHAYAKLAIGGRAGLRAALEGADAAEPATAGAR